MIDLSERQYAARTGLSRGAIQKAKLSGRLALYADGSIDAAASDAPRATATDPAKSRRRGGTAEDAETEAARPKNAAPASRLKPLPVAAVAGDLPRQLVAGVGGRSANASRSAVSRAPLVPSTPRSTASWRVRQRSSSIAFNAAMPAALGIGTMKVRRPPGS